MVKRPFKETSRSQPVFPGRAAISDQKVRTGMASRKLVAPQDLERDNRSIRRKACG